MLALLWGGVFIPAILRVRQDTSPIATVSSFRRGLEVLSKGGPKVAEAGRWVVTPSPRFGQSICRRRSVQRRRRLFLGLLIAACVSLTLAIGTGDQLLIKLHLGIDVALAGYILLLIEMQQARRQAIQRARRPRYGPPARGPILAPDEEREYVSVVRL
ncbi:MAG: hypothetical protein ACRDJ4_08105 [Actinomycetota bacterium]